MKKVLITGSQGFIGGYICRELLERGYEVFGVDNYSKYGRVKREHDSHPNFTLAEIDLAKSGAAQKLKEMLVFEKIDNVIAGAAMIGGISYFHKYAYDLLATNERINANTFDACISRWQAGAFRRLVVISSSMVFEGADLYEENIDSILAHYGADCCGISSIEDTDLSPWPSKEDYQSELLPPPASTYGFQKLAAEYMAKGANEQYGLPYTIVRPFNCVGLGEEDAVGDEVVLSGNVKLMMSHVLPDLVNKILKGQRPLRILGDGSQTRCYTHGKDIAKGIRLALESDRAVNEDFNISVGQSTTVLELAKAIWDMHYDGRVEFSYESDEPFRYDVQKRIPDVTKVKELLDFEAAIPLKDSIKEVLCHMRAANANV